MVAADGSKVISDRNTAAGTARLSALDIWRPSAPPASPEGRPTSLAMDPLEGELAGFYCSPSASRTALSPLNNHCNPPGAVPTPCSAAVHVAEGQCNILTPVGQRPAAASPRASAGHASHACSVPRPDAGAGAGCRAPGISVPPSVTSDECMDAGAHCTAVHMEAASASPSGGGWAVCSTQLLGRQSLRTTASPADGPHHREPLVAVPDALSAEAADAVPGDPADFPGPAGTGAELQEGAGHLEPQDGRTEQPIGQPMTTVSDPLDDELLITAAALQPGVRSPQHGERTGSQAKAAGLPAGPRGELLVRVTAASCGGQQAAPSLPQWLVERLGAFPDCLLDAVKSGELLFSVP